MKRAKVTDKFREGESDEYDSEADDVNIDTDALDFDLLKVKDSKNENHNALLALVTKFGE